MVTDSYGWPTNDTFDGIMGLFQNKQIQMCVHGVHMREERLLYAEFTGDLFTPRLIRVISFENKCKYILILFSECP